MSTLEELQRKFQQAILNQDSAILDDIKDTSKERRSVLLNVYQNAYGARLIEFLENDYPLTYAYLGDEHFQKIATDYYKHHPSDNPNARWFGRHFPAFLASHENYAGNAECAELAALEHGLATAFDAEDIEPLSLSSLTSLPPEEWPRLTFKAHPSVTTLKMKTSAHKIWTALNNEQTPEPVETLKQPQQLICWRGENMARFRKMDYDEAMIWNEAMKGANFSVLCELLGTYWPEDETPLKAAGFLQAWLDSEFLIAS